MAIPDYVKDRFEVLKRAFKAGDVALMECEVVDSNGNLEFVLCAVNRRPKKGSKEATLEMVPLGRIFDEANPYNRLVPPT